MMSHNNIMLRDDVVMSCDVCHLHHVMMSSITSCTLCDDDIMSCDVHHLHHVMYVIYVTF